MKKLSCFKAYDIRGQLGPDLNPDVAYRIGYAFAQHLGASRVAIGGDIRATSELLKLSVARGLIDAGAEVIDIGTVGTEEIYHASFYLDVDGGIEVTASHNPLDYNGMKMVGRGAQPISGDSGLREIQAIAESSDSPYQGMLNDATAEKRVNDEVKNDPRYTEQSTIESYVEQLLSFVDLGQFSSMRLVVNSGNGAAGHVIDALEIMFHQQKVPIEFIRIHHEPDPTFPNGIPNPLLPENRAVTAEAVLENQADFGIAWDGDFDRCFLFDENGRFIEGYYIVGLLAEAFLRKHPGEKIIHDPRLTWNTIDQVENAGGIPVQSKTGHAFIKERMRLENAIYGGEMSAHHYFRDFAYCDSGMIPWLLVAELVSVSGQPLSTLVNERMRAYPCSGEINYRVDDVQKTLDRIVSYYTGKQNENMTEATSQGTQSVRENKDTSNAPVIDKTDGISLEFDDWRFNLRASNTEPLLRLNVEARANSNLVADKVREIEQLISLS